MSSFPYGPEIRWGPRRSWRGVEGEESGMRAEADTATEAALGPAAGRGPSFGSFAISWEHGQVTPPQVSLTITSRVWGRKTWVGWLLTPAPLLISGLGPTGPLSLFLSGLAFILMATNHPPSFLASNLHSKQQEME